MAGYVGLERTVATGGANGITTVTVGGGAAGAADGVRRRVLYITVHYSAGPTAAGVGLTLDSGAGAGYDTLLYTGSANVQNAYGSQLQYGELILSGDDCLVVAAPAGGGVITSSVTVVCEGYYGANQ